MKKVDRVIQIIRDLNEESGPTMSMGHGQIAGSVEAGDDPPVRKGKRKYPTLGRKSRKPWLDYLRSSSNGRRS